MLADISGNNTGAFARISMVDALKTTAKMTDLCHVADVSNCEGCWTQIGECGTVGGADKTSKRCLGRWAGT